MDTIVVRLRLLAAAMLMMICGAGAADAAPLRVALLPFTDTVALLKLYQPLRRHLQDALGQPVELYTAADFPAHFRDIQDGEFDLAITGPHFGAWAVEHGHRPLLRYRPMLSPILVVRKGAGITSATQLRGKVVALSNPYSTSSLGGQRWLADLGLEAGRDYRVQVSPTHTTAIMSVALGEADAAITTHTPVTQAPDTIRDAVTIIASPLAVPHLFTIAAPRVSEADAARIKSALLAFEQTAEGMRFFADSGYQGYQELTPADVAAMRPYVELLLRMGDGGGK